MFGITGLGPAGAVHMLLGLAALALGLALVTMEKGSRLLTVGVGVLAAWLQRPRHWLQLHARFMAWSYAGVLAAFFSEIGARLPGVGFLPGVLVPSVTVIGIAALVIGRTVPRLAQPYGAPARGPAMRHAK